MSDPTSTRILFGDDDDYIRDAFTDAMTLRGHEVVTVWSADALLGSVADSVAGKVAPFDFIITDNDYGMWASSVYPSALAVLTEVRHVLDVPHGPRLIAFSGSDIGPQVEDAGFEFFSKGSLHELVAAIGEATRG